jgi:stearoyl-CoA 9-desaturase NADPH oxidoreductase
MFTQTSGRSFAQTVRKRVLGSDLVDLLTGPHGVDRYTELVAPTWTMGEARAKVVDVRRSTGRSVTLTLAPNQSFTSTYSVKAGQYVNLTVDIDGRRHTRCYSPANAEGSRNLELTIGHHDGGLVSTYLYERARRGMVVGLAGVGGDFVLPVLGDSGRPRRILFVSGGSGITPVMAMLRTLVAEGHTQAPGGEIAFVHYARTAAEACYRDELAGMPGVRVLHGYTRSNAGDLVGRFGAEHLAAAMPSADVVFVCGPTALVEGVKQHCENVFTESFVPPVFEPSANPSGGRITFSDSGIDVVDDGRSLLEQAETAGLTPQNGCRMGICHTCTRRKTAGTVRNLTTGAVSTGPDEDVQICVSVPVGDVELSL